jgi:RimJ/RimL family protein N-acetyltransferase
MAKPVFPELTTPRLALRKFVKTDAPRLTELLRDEDVTRYLAFDLSMVTVKGEENFIGLLAGPGVLGEGLHDRGAGGGAAPLL